LVNVVAAPLAAVTVLTGLGALAPYAVLGEAAAWLFEPALVAAAGLLAVAEFSSELPGAGVEVFAVPAVAAVALAALPFAGLATGRSRRIVCAVLATAALSSVAGAVYDRFRADRLDVTFVSVGQGDSSIVRLPGGRVVVFDGGRPGRGHSVVAPLLDRMHIGRIDYLVASHVQDDHWGGLADLLERFEIGEVWYPGGLCESQRFSEFLEASTAAGARVVDVGAVLEAQSAGSAGSTVRRSGVEGWTIRALWPRETSGSCSDNDRSIVLRIEFEKVAVLLAGDVEAGAEARLVERAPGDLRADVAAMPHHASATSSTAAWVAAVRPRIAVASVGRDNRYGFPRAEVVERYRDLGAETYRTDVDGAVEVAVSGRELQVRTAKIR
jgi:competence protein ComEC